MPMLLRGLLVSQSRLKQEGSPTFFQPIRVKTLRPHLWGSRSPSAPSWWRGRGSSWAGCPLAHLVAFQSLDAESTFSRSSQEVFRTSFPPSPAKHWPTKTAVESAGVMAVSTPKGSQLLLKLHKHQRL